MSRTGKSIVNIYNVYIVSPKNMFYLLYVAIITLCVFLPYKLAFSHFSTVLELHTIQAISMGIIALLAVKLRLCLKGIDCSFKKKDLIIPFFVVLFAFIFHF